MLCLAACSSSPAGPEAAGPVDEPRPSSATRDLPLDHQGAPPEVFELTEEKVTGDRYRITGDATRIRVVSPDANRGINARLALIDPTTAASVDQAACVTWNGPYDTIIQPGVVLRLQVDAGVTRAIMVTQNVWAKARQTLNVHVVDSSAPNPLKVVGRVRVAAGIGDFWTPIPPPWRFCARVIAGVVQVTA